MKEKVDKTPIGLIILVIIIVVIFFIVYIATLGKVGTSGPENLPEECNDTIEQAKKRHAKLKILIDKQENLKIRLDKLFKRIYFSVRLILVLLWFSLIYVLYYFGYVYDLGAILNYSEASILILFVLNFLTFGSISNLKDFIDFIKTKVENIIYGRYVKIDEKINLNKVEEERLRKDIEKHEGK